MMPDWYVGYVDLKGNDTFPEHLKKQLNRQQYYKKESRKNSHENTKQFANMLIIRKQSLSLQRQNEI